MKYFNLFVVMVVLCAFQWNVVSAAKKNVIVNFAEDTEQLILYNKEKSIKDITDCRFDLNNKNIICHIYYEKAIKTCDEPLCGSARYFIDYDLRMPITKYTGNSKSSCTVTNGSTFKSTRLLAVNENNKWVQTQSIANYKIVFNDDVPGLPKEMKPSTQQRFEFVTTSGCKFSAYYEKVESINLDYRARA